MVLSQIGTMYSRGTKISVSALDLKSQLRGAIIWVNQNTYQE